MLTSNTTNLSLFTEQAFEHQLARELDTEGVQALLLAPDAPPAAFALHVALKPEDSDATRLLAAQPLSQTTPQSVISNMEVLKGHLPAPALLQHAQHLWHRAAASATPRVCRQYQRAVAVVLKDCLAHGPVDAQAFVCMAQMALRNPSVGFHLASFSGELELMYMLSEARDADSNRPGFMKDVCDVTRRLLAAIRGPLDGADYLSLGILVRHARSLPRELCRAAALISTHAEKVLNAALPSELASWGKAHGVRVFADLLDHSNVSSDHMLAAAADLNHEGDNSDSEDESDSEAEEDEDEEMDGSDSDSDEGGAQVCVSSLSNLIVFRRFTVEIVGCFGSRKPLPGLDVLC